jgi:hypothetical protein
VTTATLSCAAYGNGTFVAGGSGGKIIWSNDGLNWTEINTESTAWFYGLI